MPRKFLSITLFLTICMAGRSYAQVDYEELKSVLIYQLSKHISWPDEKNIKEFQIGFYGNNQETYQKFADLNSLEIRKKPIIAKKIANLKHLEDLQILVIDKQHSEDLFLEASLIENKHILLISDESKDLKNVMLNIVYSQEEKQMSYEINSANIILEGMSINPDLLLLRGTEIDVRHLYRDMKAQLNEEKKALNEQIKLVENQRQLVDRHKSEIVKLTEYSQELNSDIGKRGVELDELLAKIDEKESAMSAQQVEFEERLALFGKLEDRVDEQENLIAKKSAVLDSLENATYKQQALIQKQSHTLNSKEDLITAQRNLIYLSAVLVLVILISLVLVFRAYKTKGALADKLEVTNRKLHEQHLDNLKLNEDLRRLNEMLEQKVHERTKGLKEKNEQLTEYAFVNSHLLRAPLSRILGLSQLLQASSSQEDLDMINAMKDSADELDSIVRRINVLLDDQGSFDRSKIEELIKKRIYDAEAQKGAFN